MTSNKSVRNEGERNMKDMQQMIPLDEWQRVREAIENCPWEAIMVNGEPVYLTR